MRHLPHVLRRQEDVLARETLGRCAQYKLDGELSVQVILETEAAWVTISVSGSKVGLAFGHQWQINPYYGLVLVYLVNFGHGQWQKMHWIYMVIHGLVISGYLWSRSRPVHLQF